VAISSRHAQTINKAAWAALFAMLLIVVAPLISVSLHHARATDPAPHTQPQHHHVMVQHENMTEHAHTPGQPMVDHAEACGYCVLLSHVPGILLLALALVYALLRLVRQASYPCFAALCRSAIWLRPVPRAPPVASALSLNYD